MLPKPHHRDRQEVEVSCWGFPSPYLLLLLLQLSQFGQLDVQAQAEVDASLDVGGLWVLLFEQLVSLCLELFDLLKQIFDGLVTVDLRRQRLQLRREQLQLLNCQAILGIQNPPGSGSNLKKEFITRLE